MTKYLSCLLLSLFLFQGNAHAQGFRSFSEESKLVTKQINCKNPKVNPASSGLGALYSCILGEGQTVKWFINEIPNTGNVKNLKFLWNEWYIDQGWGVQTDEVDVQNSLQAIIKLYAPNSSSDLINAFWGSNNQVIENEYFKLEYTFHQGPSINERMIKIEEK